MVMTATFSLAIKAQALNELSSLYTYLAVGSGTTPATEDDTALVAETHREARFDVLVMSSSINVSIYLDITENNGNTQAEVGIFDAPSSGTCYNRALVTPYAKTATKNVFYNVKTNLLEVFA